MKINKISGFIIACLAVVGFASCSKESKDNEESSEKSVSKSAASYNGDLSGLMAFIPADVDYAAFLNIQTAAQSAGGSVNGSKITIPNYLKSLIPTSEIDEAINNIAKSGINFNGCAVVGNFKENLPVVILGIDNTNDFANFLVEGTGYTKQSSNNGYSVYGMNTWKDSDPRFDSYSYVVIKDKTAFILPDVTKITVPDPIAFVKRYAENQTPIASKGYGAYMTQGNAAGMIVRFTPELLQNSGMLYNSALDKNMQQLIEGVFAIKVNLNGDALTASGKYFTFDGSPKSFKNIYPNLFNTNAKISRQALEYLNPEESLVMAFSLENVNWDEYMDIVQKNLSSMIDSETQLYLSILKTYLEKLDGTIALGFGLTNGLESIKDMKSGKDIMDQFKATFVIGTKSGQAQQLLSDLTALVNLQGIPVNQSGNGISVNIPELGNLYGDAQGDLLIFSNVPISRNPNSAILSLTNLPDYIFGFAFAMNKTNPLMKELEINDDLSAGIYTDMASEEIIFKSTISGNNKGYIENLFKLILDISKQQDKINSTINSSHNSFDTYSYDYDDYNW